MTNACQITSRMDDQKEIFLGLVLTFCLAKNTFLADINEQGPFESMFMTENRAEIEFLNIVKAVLNLSLLGSSKWKPSE